MSNQSESPSSNNENVLSELRRFPNENAICAAFRARLIDEHTCEELLEQSMQTRKPSVLTQIADAVFEAALQKIVRR